MRWWRAASEERAGGGHEGAGPVLILRSHSLDPYRNLAVEEYLLGQVALHGQILYLWQSDHTVVVGKNQNPWRECRLERLRQDRGLLARRVSGGGAVYHDLGNLNFSLVQPRERYSEDRQFEFVRRVLSALGVGSERMGRSSLSVEGKKISGNAFCLRGNSALHHGTLLVSSRLDRLARYLEPADTGIATRAISSVPAEVANLKAFVPSLDVQAVAQAFIDVFAAEQGEAAIVQKSEMLDTPELRTLQKHHVSWEWCYGHSPPFDMTLATTFAWGALRIHFHVVHGKIVRADIESDAMDGAEIGHLEGELLDCPFKESALARRVRKCIGRDGNAFLEDIAGWLNGLALS